MLTRHNVDPYCLWIQLFITVRINGNYNSNICNNANFNWKSLKSQKMQATNIFNYSSLPGPGFKPTTFRSMNLIVIDKTVLKFVVVLNKVFIIREIELNFEKFFNKTHENICIREKLPLKKTLSKWIHSILDREIFEKNFTKN